MLGRRRGSQGCRSPEGTAGRSRSSRGARGRRRSPESGHGNGRQPSADSPVRRSEVPDNGSRRTCAPGPRASGKRVGSRKKGAEIPASVRGRAGCAGPAARAGCPARLGAAPRGSEPFASGQRRAGREAQGDVRRPRGAHRGPPRPAPEDGGSAERAQRARGPAPGTSLPSGAFGFRNGDPSRAVPPVLAHGPE